MTFNRIITVCAILAMLVSVSGCGRVAEAEQIPLPVLDCKKKISVEQGSDFKIDEYCTISPAEAKVSLMSEPNTEEIGLHTLSVLVSDGQHNNFLIKNLEYEVVKAIPECPDNSEWDEESESCKCVDGYKDMGEDGDVACEIIPVCEIGYRYDEKIIPADPDHRLAVRLDQPAAVQVSPTQLITKTISQAMVNTMLRLPTITLAIPLQSQRKIRRCQEHPMMNSLIGSMNSCHDL